VTKNVELATFTQTFMIRTVLLNTGSSPNIEYSWIWDKYSLFTDGPYVAAHRSDRILLINQSIDQNLFSEQ